MYEIDLLGDLLSSIPSSAGVMSVQKLATVGKFSLLVSANCDVVWPIGKRCIHFSGQGFDTLESGSISISAQPLPSTEVEFTEKYCGTEGENAFPRTSPEYKEAFLHSSGGFLFAIQPDVTLACCLFQVDPGFSSIANSFIRFLSRSFINTTFKYVINYMDGFHSTKLQACIALNQHFYADIAERCMKYWNQLYYKEDGLSHNHREVTTIPSADDDTVVKESQDVLSSSLITPNSASIYNVLLAISLFPSNISLYLQYYKPSITYSGIIRMYTKGKTLGFGRGWSNLTCWLDNIAGLYLVPSKTMSLLDQSVQQLVSALWEGESEEAEESDSEEDYSHDRNTYSFTSDSTENKSNKSSISINTAHSIIDTSSLPTLIVPDVTNFDYLVNHAYFKNTIDLIEEELDVLNSSPFFVSIDTLTYNTYSLNIVSHPLKLDLGNSNSFNNQTFFEVDSLLPKATWYVTKKLADILTEVHCSSTSYKLHVSIPQTSEILYLYTKIEQWKDDIEDLNSSPSMLCELGQLNFSYKKHMYSLLQNSNMSENIFRIDLTFENVNDARRFVQEMAAIRGFRKWDTNLSLKYNEKPIFI